MDCLASRRCDRARIHISDVDIVSLVVLRGKTVSEKSARSLFDTPRHRALAPTSARSAMSEAVSTTAAIQSPILLRAPNGAEVWTVIELQGSIESKASNSLNGVEFAQLSWEPNTVSHARAHRPRRSTACTLAPACCRPHLPSSSGSRRRQALGRTSRSRWSSSTRSRATHATMRVRASLRAEPATRMVAPTR
jgi:hypothetical protein